MLAMHAFALLAVTVSGQDLFLARRRSDAHVEANSHVEAAVPYLEHFHPSRKNTILRLLGGSYASGKVPLTTAAATTFRPQDFGADPTGTEDSSDGFTKAISAMLAIAVPVPGGVYKDLGGASLDLAGGRFSVGSPVSIPKGYMNFRIGGGTLAAINRTFPRNGTLLHVGDASTDKGKACMQVDISHLTLDGAGVANTALALINTQYANVGPAVMIFGFHGYGIKTDGSGGGYIHKSWLGEEAPDKRQWLAFDFDSKASVNLTATAISLENGQHDYYVEDVIVWSGRVGVKSQNGANQLQGVHTWNLMTTMGGIGILLESGGGKVIDSYLDFCPLVIVDPINAVVSGNLFLAKANLVLQASSRSKVQHLAVTSNRWSSEGKYTNATIVVNGNFTGGVEDTVIEDNVADSMWAAKSTRATRTATLQKNASEVTFDFTNDLLFDTKITEVSCSIQAWSFVDHYVQPPSDRKVVVHLSKAISGKVTCTVDQSSRTHGAH